MEHVKNGSGFVCIFRIVGVVHFVTSFSLLGFFFREIIFGFLQIVQFETKLEWLLMFVTVSFTLVWNICLGVFIEAHSWRFSTISKPVDDVLHMALFKIWELSVTIFIVVDLIGNLILHLSGDYDWYLVFTWILPILFFGFVVITFKAERREEEAQKSNASSKIVDRVTINGLVNKKLTSSSSFSKAGLMEYNKV